MLEAYKAWVRRHPGVVQNLELLLYVTMWSPARLGASASEFGYEAYHAAIGLLSVWHQHLLGDGAAGGAAASRSLGVWLDALEQVGGACVRRCRTRGGGWGWPCACLCSRAAGWPFA